MTLTFNSLWMSFDSLPQCICDTPLEQPPTPIPWTLFQSFLNLFRGVTMVSLSPAAIPGQG